MGRRWAGSGLPNGSRLSCGASAGGRKRPRAAVSACWRTNATFPLKAGPDSFKRLLGARVSERDDNGSNAVWARRALGTGNQMPPIHDRLPRTRRVGGDLRVRHRGGLAHLDTGAAIRVRTRGPVGVRRRAPLNGKEVNGGSAPIGKRPDGRGGAHRETAPDGARQIRAGEG